MQVFGETSVEVIERDVSRLAAGFVGLGIGAGLTYFIAVSEELCTFNCWQFQHLELKITASSCDSMSCKS